MTIHHFRHSFTLIVLVTLITTAFAQSQSVKKSSTRQSSGTAQLPGNNGKLGQIYTLGKQSLLNIKLISVRYSKTRWNHGNETVAPNLSQKLLIINFNVQNPNKEITRLSEGTLKFTAIDGEGANHEGEFGLVQKGQSTELEINLKPAQHIDAETTILVPANSPVPKLMVAHSSGGGVLRYDLHGLVGPLTKPFSDNGFDALPIITGLEGTSYPLLKADVTIGLTSFKSGSFGDLSERDGQIFMTTLLSLIARTPSNLALQIHGEALDADGEKFPSINLQKASTEAELGGIIEPGEPVRCRILFFVPKGTKIVKVRIWEGDLELRSTAVEVPIQLTAADDGSATHQN